MPDIFDLIDLGQKADIEKVRQRDEFARLGVTPPQEANLTQQQDIFDQVAKNDQTEAAIEAAGRTPGQTPTRSKSFGDQAGQFVKESVGPAAGAYGGAKAGAVLGTMVS